MSSTIKTLIDENSSVLSTTEWYKQQTIDPPNKCYYVKSETNTDTVYTITYATETNCYSCNCAAWSLCFYNINQSDNQRTCKHIIAVRGHTNEQQRIATNGGKWLYKPARKVKKN